MMESTTPSPSPKTRWFDRRKLLFVLVLLAGCALSFMFWDALFMPKDLQRMQGSWRFVRIDDETDPAIERDIGKSMAINGRTMILPFGPNDPLLIELNDNRILLCALADTERNILGCKVRLPTWLCRPKEHVYGTFEFSDRQLIIYLMGEVNAAKNQQDDQKDRQEKWYLERE